MRHFMWIVAGLAAIGVTACNPAQEDPGAAATDPEVVQSETPVTASAVASFAALREVDFVDANGAEANLDGVIAALPDYVTLDWDTKSYQADTGATMFTGLAFGLEIDETAVGVRMEQASLWGFDADLITARLQGERLEETGALFTRLDGGNLTYYGVEAAFVRLFEEFAFRFELDLPEEMDFAMERFEFTAEELVITDAALRPWELNKAPASILDGLELEPDDTSTLLDFVHLGQQMLAISRSMEYGAAAYYDTAGSFHIRQPGSDVEIDMSWDLYGYEGLSGLDIDRAVVYNSRTVQSSTYSDFGEEFGAPSLPDEFGFVQEEIVGLTEIEDIRLDKVMGYLTRSELPGMAERDLLSLGRWNVSDYTAKLDDKTVFTVDTASMNADQFAWLIPTDMSFNLDAATVNIGELTSFGKGMVEVFASSAEGELASEEAESELELVVEGLGKALDLLPEHGLSTITFDMDGSATWSANDGLSDFATSVSADGFGEGSFDMALSLPAYDALQAAYESDDKESAFEQAFQDAFAFRGMNLMERDGGGFDKILGFAQAIGQEYPDEGWGAMIGNMEPPQMRSYLATITRMGKAEAGRDFPPAEQWIEALASYLETGGVFEVQVSPPEPITVEMIENFDSGPDPEPDQIVEMFGISVTHTN